MGGLTEFWLVWCNLGGAPTLKHDTEASAIHEAERLARANHGRHFWVLHSVAVCSVNSVLWEKAHPADCSCQTCIPF